MKQFQWDAANIGHIARHGIGLTEAEQAVMNDPLDLSFETVDGEERVAQLGETDAGWIVVVVSTWRGELIRVVTAYPCSPAALEFVRNPERTLQCATSSRRRNFRVKLKKPNGGKAIRMLLPRSLKKLPMKAP